MRPDPSLKLGWVKEAYRAGQGVHLMRSLGE